MNFSFTVLMCFFITVLTGIGDVRSQELPGESDCPSELTNTIIEEEDCRSFQQGQDTYVRVDASNDFKNPFENTEELVSDPLMLIKGSGAFRRCQMMTSMPWKQLIESIKGKGVKIDGQEFKALWKTKMDLYLKGEDDFENTGLHKSTFKLNKGEMGLIRLYGSLQNKNKIDEILKSHQTREKMEYLQNSLEALYRKAQEWKNRVRSCTALAVLTMDADFSQKDFPTRVSADKKLSCAAQGIETRDYGPCTNVVNIYDGALVATMGVKTVQGMDYQSHLHEEENKLFENQAKSSQKALDKKEGEDGEDGALSSDYDNDQITAPLKAQKSSIEKQKGYAEQRIILHGAQAAALFAAAGAIPKPSDLVKKCTKVISGQAAQKEYGETLSFINKIKIKYLDPYKNVDTEFLNEELWKNINNEILSSNETKTNPELNEAICWEGFRSGAVITHPLNQQSKDGATALAIQAGVQAGTSVAQAVMLGDQANRLQDIIDGVKDHKPEEKFSYDFDENNDCKLNPMHPACKDKEDVVKEVGLSDNPIIINGGNLTKAPGSLDTSDDGKKVAEGDIPHVDSGNEGRIIPDSASGGAGSNSFESSAPVAKVKRGSGRGGSGGRFSVNSVSAPGGGGKKKNNGRGPRKTSDSGKGLSVAYNGGKGAAYQGSGKGRRSKKTKSKNPFANLFKKGKKGKSVLNFRDIAGKRTGDSIWSMISRRYNTVHKKKRLLHYVPIK